MISSQDTYAHKHSKAHGVYLTHAAALLELLGYTAHWQDPARSA